MSESPEFLTVEDDLSWQRGDTPVGLLAGAEEIAAGNEMGASIDVDDDDDNGDLA